MIDNRDYGGARKQGSKVRDGIGERSSERKGLGFLAALRPTTRFEQLFLVTLI
jgi:hypothetical protein